MPLSHEQVEHISQLARLDLTPAEIEKFTTELSHVLEYVDQLQSVDTKGVELKNQIKGEREVLRDDIVEPSLEKEESLKNAPKRDNDFFLVPKVLG
jgi:aspartyl-tRNA(Asn)/glutamyl-tRNA(Gln) amidotransferase subunit C